MRMRMFALTFLAFTTCVAPAHAEPPKRPVVITISEETTFFTEPLQEDGYVDYRAALNAWRSEGVRPETNFIVALLDVMKPDQVVGLVDQWPEGETLRRKMRDAFYSRLGVKEPKREGPFLVLYNDAVDAWLEPIEDEEERDAREASYWKPCQDGPWRAEDYPETAKWLEANSPMLDKVVELSKLPQCYAPLIEDPDGEFIAVVADTLPFMQNARGLVQSLRVRINHRLAEGDIEDAFEDFQAIRRIARHLARRASLTEWISAQSDEKQALDALADLTTYCDLTAEQSRKFAAEYASLPPMGALSETVDKFERCVLLEIIAQLAENGGVGIYSEIGDLGLLAESRDLNAPEAIIATFGRAVIDWDKLLRQGNLFYDNAVTAIKTEGIAERCARMDKLRGRLSDQSMVLSAGRAGPYLLNYTEAYTNLMGTLVMTLTCTYVYGAVDIDIRGAMYESMAETVLALEAYKADHGEHPEALADLVPDYMESVPLDLYTDDPLQYHRTDDGYKLYSLGQNGEDDTAGGDPNARYSKNRGVYWDDCGVILPAPTE